MSETQRLDEILSEHIDDATRTNIWASADAILSQGPNDDNNMTPGRTALALGYVQSGKTTSITALAARAADNGYQVIVALLGSTNLLLDQNRTRLEDSLGVARAGEYVWYSTVNPSTESAGKSLADYVSRGRVCLVAVLKHAGRIRSVAKQLEKLPADTKVLIIDDEADQASLNTGKAEESKTYSAIKDLRTAVPMHLYVQYTATPYAPLLLETTDALKPDSVEFLLPGNGYTGGKEFFLDNAATVVRNVPMLDEQASKAPPLELQNSLAEALASFLAGATLMLNDDPMSTPISMLVHSTARNDVQARYEFLIRRQVQQWKDAMVRDDTIPPEVLSERRRLVANGAQDTDDSVFASKLKFVLAETTTWLVNSTADINKVEWHVAPIHILVGGNKLDRGFTVEGLTVTYMNRPASPQVDTLEQRARAFGYRADLLPYCQFFASKKTIRSLTEIVHTEEDLRARLRDHVSEGGSVETWAQEIGLLLPEGMAPTRSSVVHAITSLGLGWHVLRNPSRTEPDNTYNRSLLEGLGLLEAPRTNHGRLQFRTLTMRDPEPVAELLRGWRQSAFSPGWLREELADALERRFAAIGEAHVVLMEESGAARVRRWEDGFGFVNLFQGRDLKPQDNGDFYPGDRNVLNLKNDPNQIVLQVHRNKIRGAEALPDVWALALYLGTGRVVRKDTHA